MGLLLALGRAREKLILFMLLMMFTNEIGADSNVIDEKSARFNLSIALLSEEKIRTS